MKINLTKPPVFQFYFQAIWDKCHRFWLCHWYSRRKIQRASLALIFERLKYKDQAGVMYALVCGFPVTFWVSNGPTCIRCMNIVATSFFISLWYVMWTSFKITPFDVYFNIQKPKLFLYSNWITLCYYLHK